MSFCHILMSDHFMLQVIASLNSDKDSLETALYELQQTAAKLENRKEQLEAEVQELQLAKEAITGKNIFY